MPTYKCANHLTCIISSRSRRQRLPERPLPDPVRSRGEGKTGQHAVAARHASTAHAEAPPVVVRDDGGALLLLHRPPPLGGRFPPALGYRLTPGTHVNAAPIHPIASSPLTYTSQQVASLKVSTLKAGFT